VTVDSLVRACPSPPSNVESGHDPTCQRTKARVARPRRPFAERPLGLWPSRPVRRFDVYLLEPIGRSTDAALDAPRFPSSSRASSSTSNRRRSGFTVEAAPDPQTASISPSLARRRRRIPHVTEFAGAHVRHIEASVRTLPSERLKSILSAYTEAPSAAGTAGSQSRVPPTARRTRAKTYSMTHPRRTVSRAVPTAAAASDRAIACRAARRRATLTFRFPRIG